jgi:PPOX class probable F420-dependent enzyme
MPEIQAEARMGLPAMSSMEVEYLLSKPLIARMATAGMDARPHVVPVWFLWDGEALYSETNVAYRKARNLRENPSCAVIIDETQGGLRFWGILMQGEAELITEPKAWVLATTRSIYTKYLGPDGIAAPMPQAMLADEHVIIKLAPKKIVTWNDTGQELIPLEGDSQ